MTEEFYGRYFFLMDRFLHYNIIPFPFEFERKLNYNDIYHLGSQFPVGYWDYINEELIHNVPLDELINDFRKKINYKQLKGLSVGGLLPKTRGIDTQHELYGGYYQVNLGEKTFNEFCDYLIRLKDRFESLEVMVLGNYYMDDYIHAFYEIKHLDQIIKNFKHLSHLFIRGGFSKYNQNSRKTMEILDYFGLNSDQFPKHLDKNKQKQESNLQTLIIQTFGMNNLWVKRILEYNLPNLKHLELNLGTRHYNGCRSIENLTPLFAGELFPNLKYLGLKDSDIANEIAYEIAHSTLIERLDVLDLSQGALTEEGAEILLNSSKISNLKFLDISSNHLSEEFISYTLDISKEKNIPIKARPQRGPIDTRYRVIRE